MDTASMAIMGFCSSKQLITINKNFTPKPPFPSPPITRTRSISSSRYSSTSTTYAVLSEASAAISEPSATVDITWQIVVGAVAGITPFTVAGIEFGKRIVKQRQCGVCNGSGLVLRADKNYIKCPACGGWLPWQSWRRFFTG